MSEVTFDSTGFRIHDEVPVPAQRPRWLGQFAHISPTSLGMFRRCPRQFYMRYVLGKKERPGEALVIGSMFHETLEFNYVDKIDSHEDKPLSEMVEYLQDAAVPKVLAESGGQDEVRWDHDADVTTGVDRARNDAVRIMSAYRTAVVPRIQPTAVEQRFEWQPDGFPIPIIGYADTITDAKRIIDTKTGKQVSKKVKPSWQLQGLTYANAWDMPVEFHSISRAATPSIATPLESESMVVSPNKQQAENLVKLMRLALDQIEWMWNRYGPDEEWPATGRLADWSQNLLPCNMCAWQKDCPAWVGENL